MRYKPPFRQTTTIEYVKGIALELRSESDRATAILAAAYADSLIEGLLVWNLLEIDTKADDLFEGNGPLSSFSSKIDMAWRMRIVAPDLQRSLHVLRRIRNDYAHLLRAASLDEPPHKDQISALIDPYRGLPVEVEMRHHYDQFSPPRRDFRVASLLLCWTMADTHGQYGESGTAAGCPLIPDFFKGRK